MLELLAPAASPEAVIAAVQSGADAISIRFGPAGRAGFSEDDFMKALRYCRIRGCRVYAEVDVSVWDSEIGGAAELAARAAEAGVSALVVQDLGLCSVLRRVAPEVPLHAGERLGFHNLAGIGAAAQLGFSRVRLPAEMTLKEIAFAAAHASVETEVQVQGETCFSRAGLCGCASAGDRRSAARGNCAELCREAFDMGGRMDEQCPISLRDTSLLTHLKELDEAGVRCARIGFAADTPELTALVTGLYAGCLRDNRQPAPDELERLSAAFGGAVFTDGGLTGEREGLFGTRPEPGNEARRVLQEARRGYENSEARRVPVHFYVQGRGGAPIRAVARDDDGNSAGAEGPRLTPSAGVGLGAGAVEGVLYRTGGTPYSCASVDARIERGFALPDGALDELRRRLLRGLTEKRAAPRKSPLGKLPPTPPAGGYPGKQAMIFEVMNAAQLTPELAELKPDYLYLPLEILAQTPEVLAPFLEAGAVPVAVLPAVVTDAEAAGVFELLRAARAAGAAEALVSSLGHVALCRQAGLEARGGAALGLTNSYAMETAASAGLLSLTVSPELTLAQIRALSKPVNAEMIVYGRLPVMLSDVCVMKRSAGRCVCSVPGRLSDNQGAVYPVLRQYGCRNLILSPLRLFLADRREDLEFSGLWGLRLSFTTESSRECVEVAKSYLGLSEYRPNGLTRGVCYRGVD